MSKVLVVTLASNPLIPTLSPGAVHAKIILPSSTGHDENSTCACTTMGEVVKALWDELTILGIAAEPLKTSRTLELAEVAQQHDHGRLTWLLWLV